MDTSAWARACNATYSQPLHTTIAVNESSSSVAVRYPPPPPPVARLLQHRSDVFVYLIEWKVTKI
jgi:hypothetical protein